MSPWPSSRLPIRSVHSGLNFRKLVARGAQTLYAIRTLRNHGLSGQRLWEVTQSTFLSRLTYASQAWYGLVGMLDANGKARLESTL